MSEGDCAESCCYSASITEVSSDLSAADVFCRWKLRWGIGRMNSIVSPGLYKAGNPTADSPVLVTANYRMSFDSLRTSISDRSFWILVLDTRGINVWCAAGKGTFGTEELVARVKETGLERVVNHRSLIVPQLGAPGIRAYTVRKETGFKVVYGPVRARDIGTFLDNGMVADETMRTVDFSLKARAELAPVELVQSLKLLLIILPYVLVFHLLYNGGLHRSVITEAAVYAGSLLIGTVGAPLLLPWLPGRALAFKGWFLGLVYAAGVGVLFSQSRLEQASWFVLLPAVTSFLTMNFTGSTPYTSLSGVKKEMRYAVPLLIGLVAAGTVLNILRIFL